MIAAFAPVAWRDGETVPGGDAVVATNSACFRYGASVFDGARVIVADGTVHIVALDMHLERLRASAAAVHLEIEHTDAVLREAALAVLRDAASSSTSIWGLRFFTFATSDTFLGTRSSTVAFALPLDDYGPGRPVRLRLGPAVRTAMGDVPRWVKSPSGYLLGRMATAAARSEGYDDALYLNEHGRITESTRASLLVVHEGEIQVPPLSEGVLPGITRRIVERLAREDGIGWTERPVTRDDLDAASGLLLTSSSLGVASVGAVNERSYPGFGLGDHLASRYAALHRDPRTADLVTMIGPEPREGR